MLGPHLGVLPCPLVVLPQRVQPVLNHLDAAGGLLGGACAQGLNLKHFQVLQELFFNQVGRSLHESPFHWLEEVALGGIVHLTVEAGQEAVLFRGGETAEVPVPQEGVGLGDVGAHLLMDEES